MKTLLTKTFLRLIQSRAILAITTFSLAVPLSASAVTGTFAWQLTTANYPGGVVKVDNAGNVITAINTTTSAVNKYNSNGTLIWSVNIGLLVHDKGHIVVDSANNVYVVGNGFAQNATTLGVVKISPNGAILWSSTFTLNSMPGSGGTAEHEASGPIVLGSNGSLYVLAIGDEIPSLSLTAPVNILRINTSTGAEQNRLPFGTQTLDFSNPMSDSAIAVDSANNVFYGSPEGMRSYSSDLQTVRWNTATTSTTFLPYSVRAIILDSANNVYVTGTAPTSGAYTMITKRLNNANGAVVWTSANFVAENLGLGFYPTGIRANDALFGGNALALDSTGTLYAVGGAQDGSGYVGGVLAQYNASTGAAQWSHELTDSDFEGTIADVAIDNNNNIHAVGLLGNGPGAGQSVISVFNTLGNLLWTTSPQFTAGVDNEMTHVALDNNSGVYVIDDVVNSAILAKYTESGSGGGTVPNGTYKIINLNSALAMEAFGQHTTNGTQIDQWAYNHGANQQWAVTSLGNGQYSIIETQCGRSLDVSGFGTANGTKIDLWDHNGGSNQQFSFTATANGYYRITPANATGSCIEGVGLSKANGTLVDLWQYNGGNNQQWIFQAP